MHLDNDNDGDDDKSNRRMIKVFKEERFRTSLPYTYTGLRLFPTGTYSFLLRIGRRSPLMHNPLYTKNSDRHSSHSSLLEELKLKIYYFYHKITGFCGVSFVGSINFNF